MRGVTTHSKTNDTTILATMERKWKAKRAKSMALGEHKENTKRLNFVDEFNKISPKNFATSKTAQVLLREYVRSHAYKMRPKGKQRHNVSALHKYLQPVIRDEWDKKQKEEKKLGCLNKTKKKQ